MVVMLIKPYQKKATIYQSGVRMLTILAVVMVKLDLSVMKDRENLIPFLEGVLSDTLKMRRRAGVWIMPMRLDS
jgi:hypothetical protein